MSAKADSKRTANRNACLAIRLGPVYQMKLMYDFPE